MKKTIEQFGWGTNYKRVRPNKWNSPIQDIWVEICYQIYMLDIDDLGESSLDSSIYEKAWEHTNKNLRKDID